MSLLRSVDALIAVSRYVARRTRAYLPDVPISVIPNFIDPQQLAAERDPKAIFRLSPKTILFVGVLAGYKGVDDLIAAYRLARDHSPQLAGSRLVLMGRARPPDRYEADPDCGIEVVTNPPRSSVVEALATCACLAVPSRCPEACPTVVLEGLAWGRPIIGTEVGGIPDLLDELPNCQIVPSGDRSALAAALAAVLELEDAAPGGIEVAPSSLPLRPAEVTQRIVGVYEAAQQARVESRR
jgi:glycosyltransferase involved in cell wall biosynthesis